MVNVGCLKMRMLLPSSSSDHSEIPNTSFFPSLVILWIPYASYPSSSLSWVQLLHHSYSTYYTIIACFQHVVPTALPNPAVGSSTQAWASC
jgi:hypothetical protein